MANRSFDLPTTKTSSSSVNRPDALRSSATLIADQDRRTLEPTGGNSFSARRTRRRSTDRIVRSHPSPRRPPRSEGQDDELPGHPPSVPHESTGVSPPRRTRLLPKVIPWWTARARVVLFKHAAAITLTSAVVVALMIVAYAIAPEPEAGWDVWEFVLFGALALSVYTGLLIASVIRLYTSPRPLIEGALFIIVMIALLILSYFRGCTCPRASRSRSRSPKPLTKISAAYFTVTVLSTVGFGDITPVLDTPRMIVTTQMLIRLTLFTVALKTVTGSVNRRCADPCRPSRRPLSSDPHGWGVLSRPQLSSTPLCPLVGSSRARPQAWHTRLAVRHGDARSLEHRVVGLRSTAQVLGQKGFGAAKKLSRLAGSANPCPSSGNNT